MQSEMAGEGVVSGEGLGADVAWEGSGSGVAELVAIAVLTTVKSLAAMFAGQRRRRQHYEPGMRPGRGRREAAGSLHRNEEREYGG
jgi:hypothetical protein